MPWWRDVDKSRENTDGTLAWFIQTVSSWCNESKFIKQETSEEKAQEKIKEIAARSIRIGHPDPRGVKRNNWDESVIENAGRGWRGP